MSIYSNVTEQHLIILRELANRQNIQRALKIKIRISRQTHDIKLAESLSPITKKLVASIKKSEVIKEPISEDDFKSNIKTLSKSSKINESMREMIGSLFEWSEFSNKYSK